MALDRLRNETQDVHRRVEMTPDMPAACADLGACRGVLSRTLGFCRSIETVMARFAWPAAGREFMPHCKVPMLRPDLRDIGVDTTLLQQRGQCSALRPTRTVAA